MRRALSVRKDREWLSARGPGQSGRMAEPKTVVEELFRRQRAGDDQVLDDLVAENMVKPRGRAARSKRIAADPREHPP